MSNNHGIPDGLFTIDAAMELWIAIIKNDPRATKDPGADAGDREFFSAQARLYGDGALNWARIGDAKEAGRLAQLAARSAFIALDGSLGFVANRVMAEGVKR